MSRFFSNTFTRFAIVGVVGFLVDLVSMLLLSVWLPHTIARGIAFWIAASSNWWWNRRITFIETRHTKHKKAALLQWLQFLAGSLVAFIPNWACYLALLSLQSSITNPTLSQIWPYLAIIPGILVGMGINYVFSRYWVFSQKKTPATNNT
ncbi:GtrA family protein [Marinomonas transparens]|uniref:GtrA family protein n=1 Tax=Marinomonas transparens TaxID=2795388 RepID=A0A934N5Y4_9GAMM|nr:GtrA family protein [Marinomonas transparens]MBJ7537521.1 GtrA family protein [Marinomonas transparens]